MTNEMRALVKAAPEVGLRMETRPVPEIGPDDVLIRVRKTGICGTDIHIWQWDDWAQRTVPVCGVVEALGAKQPGGLRVDVPGRPRRALGGQRGQDLSGDFGRA